MTPPVYGPLELRPLGVAFSHRYDTSFVVYSYACKFVI